MEEPTNLVTSMSEGETNNPIDAAAEITDAMMSSLADVVKTAISSNEAEEHVAVDNNEIEEVDAENTGGVIDATVDTIVSEGEAAHRSGDHSAALVAFNKAIALDPSNAMAWFNRGVLLEAEQDSRGARQSFVICLDLDPKHGPALANLAVLLDRLGENDGAIEIAHRALQHFPGHPHLVKIMDTNTAAGGVLHSTPKVMPHTQEKLVDQNLTPFIDSNTDNIFEEVEETVVTNEHIEQENDVLNDLQNVETVAEIHEEIITPTIDMDSLCVQATEMLSKGDAKGALTILKEHLHGAGAQHFDSWNIAAGAMAAMGLDEHSISAYMHALSLDGTNAKCYFNLGALHERMENNEAATKCFVSALQNDSTYTKAASRLANIAEINGDIENLLNARRMLIEQDGGRNALATLLVELAEGESTILENTAGLPPTIPEGPELAAEAVSLCSPNTMLMGRALSASGDHTESVKCWKGMIQMDKINPKLWLGLARSLEAAGDMATAQRCHEKVNTLTNPVPEPEVEVPAISETQPSFEMAPQAVQPTPEPVAQIEPVQAFEAEPVANIPQEESTYTPLPELSARPEQEAKVPEANIVVDLAAAALEATSRSEASIGIDTNSRSIANQDIEWYNKGVGLIEDKKYREALSCFDRALPSFADNDEMVIRILNGRGNALYYLEDYPKCVESYHKAMVINPGGVQGKTLYNMGTAYAEMQRFGDGIKCFEQAVPRGLDKDQQKLAKEQIRRCNILLKEQQRKMS
jgi:tetratricopeptide (TPR) repeat protein